MLTITNSHSVAMWLFGGARCVWIWETPFRRCNLMSNDFIRYPLILSVPCGDGAMKMTLHNRSRVWIEGVASFDELQTALTIDALKRNCPIKHCLGFNDSFIPVVFRSIRSSSLFFFFRSQTDFMGNFTQQLRHSSAVHIETFCLFYQSMTSRRTLVRSRQLNSISLANDSKACKPLSRV